jgi:hypothetical protein
MRASTVPNVERVKPLPLITGFAPLIVFGAMSARVADNGPAWSAAVALALAVAAMWFERPRILSALQAGVLTTMTAIGFAGGPAVDRWLFDWSSGVVTTVVGLVILATAPVFPFAERYARLTTARAYWGSPTFTSINRVLSVVWGAALSVIGAASLGAAGIGGRAATADSAHVADLVLNWIAPIAILWSVAKFTAAYPQRVASATYQTVSSDDSPVAAANDGSGHTFRRQQHR